MAAPWARQYAPKNLKEILGQDHAVKAARQFVSQFPKKRSLLIYGPSGSGKTALATALADEIGWELLEVNASMTRNKDGIETQLGNAIKQRSFFSDGKIILVDELDGLSGSDRGGVGAIANLIKETQFPIIMTCRDPFERKLKPIKKIADAIELRALNATIITTLLERICKKESITHDTEVIQTIARRSQGDARAAINDLQLMCAGTKHITKEQLDELTERAKVQTIENALTNVFKSTDIDSVRFAFDEVPEDVDQRFLWIDYNLPKEYTKVADLARAYGSLTKADVYRSRIRRRQHWRFLVYVNALLTAGVSAAKDQPYRTPPDYKQTTRLLRIWQVNVSQAKKKSIAEKIARITHTSPRRILQDFSLYQRLFQRDQRFSSKLIHEANLDKDEIAWMLK